MSFLSPLFFCGDKSREIFETPGRLYEPLPHVVARLYNLSTCDVCFNNYESETIKRHVEIKH